MQPDYREMFLKNYLYPEERDQSENDSGTSEDLHSNEVSGNQRKQISLLADIVR